METRINIAEILRNKPHGIKLYSPIFGNCTFCYIHDETSDICVRRPYNEMSYFNFEGLYNTAGECLLFPSKEMRDWKKFAWKPGDVLVNKDGYVHIIFDGFEDDAYKNFHGQYYLWEEGGSIVSFEEDENYMQTSDFNKANKEDAQEYIHKIEKELGGKLNLETLKIEKPEFKDGDIIKMTWDKYSAIAIFWKYSNFGKGFDSHIFFNIKTKIIEYNIHGHTLQDIILRLATEEEKQQLFDALAKKGKQWYSEKKMIVDLKPKCEFKPFDKVLGRNGKGEVWEAELFSHYREELQYPFRCIGFNRKYCIPYNEETAHLLGTTDDWEE